jgi:hypothetical protein
MRSTPSLDVGSSIAAGELVMQIGELGYFEIVRQKIRHYEYVRIISRRNGTLQHLLLKRQSDLPQ